MQLPTGDRGDKVESCALNTHTILIFREKLPTIPQSDYDTNQMLTTSVIHPRIAVRIMDLFYLRSQVVAEVRRSNLLH